jgi:hypothetical protein
MDLRDRNPLNSNIRNGLSNFIQLERLDDGGDQLHAFIPAYSV